jgi:thioesterase domain-containing protein
MAEAYLARLTGNDRPRIFVGASFGGLVAYEMARQQAERGERVAAIMLDSQASDDPKLLASISPVTLDVFRQKLVKYSGMYPGISDEEIDRYFRLYNHHLMLLKHSDLRPSAARTALVLATGDKVPAHQHAMIDYWARRAADLRVEKVDGDHSTVIEPPQLSVVVDLIRDEAASVARREARAGVAA